MQDAEDLLPVDVMKWQLEQLRLFRLSGGSGFIRINVQDGYIHTYGQYTGKKHVRKRKPS